MKLLSMQEEYSGLRQRTGSGKPGLNVLLGGTVTDEGTSDTFGGAGAIGATARLATAYKDTRVKQVASGSSSSGPIGGGGGGGGNYRPRPPQVAK